MARTTAAQFARQLRRLGATVTMTDGYAIARYRGVAVTIRFHRDIDAFDVAWRCDVPPEAATAIGSMASVRRTLGLPTHPVVTLGRTGRRNSLVHILRPGWYAIAECGVGLRGDKVDGSPREATCRRCRSIWRQRQPISAHGCLRRVQAANPPTPLNQSQWRNLVTDPQHTEPDQTRTDTGERGRLHTMDIQALRRADSVCFHTLPDGSAHIDALLTTWAHPTPRIFTTTEQRLFPDTGHADRRRRIPVTAAVVGFGHDGRWYERGLPAATAFAMIHAAGLDDVWCSIVEFLRAGDVLSLRWRASNNNQYLREAGLHRDELRLAIRRGPRDWTFLVDIATGPDNPARMIRRGPA